MSTEYDIAPPIDMDFANAVNTVVPQTPQVTPTANFNSASRFEVKAYEPTQPNLAPQKVAQDIAQQAMDTKVTGINTGRALTDDIEGVEYSLKDGATCGILGDCMGAMGKLTQDMKSGIQPPANNTPQPVQQAPDIQAQPTPDNTVYTQRAANFELNQFSPSGPM